MAKSNIKSVDDYIDSQPEDVRRMLEVVRNTIRKAAPQAQEVISYNMPTYLLNGHRLLHFAVWKQHYSIYAATERVLAAFQQELAGYQIEKGTIRFPLAEAVPVKLIASIVKFRAGESADRSLLRPQATAASAKATRPPAKGPKSEPKKQSGGGKNSAN